MAEGTERICRYLEETGVNACRTEDAQDRITELRQLQSGIDEAQVTEHVQILAAVSDETRYQIVRLLSEAEDELCVCEITPLLSVSESAVSHALSKLTDADVIGRRKEGRWRMYSLTDRGKAIVQALEESV